MNDNSHTTTSQSSKEQLNDLFVGENINDVDISSFFSKTNVRPTHKLGKNKIIDLQKAKNKILSFFEEPRLKLLKLQRPATKDVYFTKKPTFLALTKPDTKKRAYILDLQEEHQYIQKNEKPLHFDIQPPKHTFRKTLKNWKPSFYKSGISLLLILCIFLGYGLFLQYYLKNVFKNISEISFESIDTFSAQTQKISPQLYKAKLLYLPVSWMNYFIGNQALNNVEYILDGGYETLQFVNNGLYFYQGTQDLIETKGLDNIMFSQLLENSRPLFRKMNSQLLASYDSLSKVGELDDPNLNQQFTSVIDKLHSISLSYALFYDNLDTILDVLGHEKKKTYLLIFQNSDEIRPMGGFMGSVGLLELYKGKVLEFEKKDIYELEWNLKNYEISDTGVAFTLPAPEGLDRISDTFGLRDANYYWDIEKSSEKIKEFLLPLNIHLDGIVYINQDIINQLLELSGPVYFDEFDTEITAGNFSLLFSTYIEAKIAKNSSLSTPKQPLFDFITLAIEQLLQQKNYQTYLETLPQLLKQKVVQIYLFDTQAKQLTSEIGISQNTDFLEYKDFNFPYFTSISGNKSDRYMIRDFEKSYTIGDNCSLQTSLNIHQAHHFSINDEIQIKNILYDLDALGTQKQDEILQIQGKGENRQFVRILLPLSATNILLDGKPGNVVTYQKYKEISFYSYIGPGQSNYNTIEYTLENPLCDDYEYYFVKQPGLYQYKIEIFQDGNLEKSLYTQSDFIY